MKHFTFARTALVSFAAAVLFSGCAQQPASSAAAPAPTAEPPAPRGEVTILYTNDTHTYINNVVKDAEGNEKPGLSFGNVAAMKADLTAAGKNVLLVDAGDHVQGTAYGAMDEGTHIIEIMNAVGYDAATLGNHEFDYGQFRAFGIMEEAEFPYISCNFYEVEGEKLVLPAYKVFDIGGAKVALVGINTPETLTKATPAYFMDPKMEKYVYYFYSGEDGKALYDSVQRAIDAASAEADYVVALGHLGVDEGSAPWRSVDVISHTTGLDAFIDGHSHTTVEYEEVPDAAGNPVVLTQTGSYFGAIGEMTLTDTGITTRLVTEYDKRDASVDAKVAEWVNTVEEELNVEIAVLDSPLYINNPANTGERLVRRAETSQGDFVADGIYWYMNEVEKMPCDIAFANGGGVRSDTEAGVYTYNSAKTVQPFGNVMCMVEFTGQEILDALEWGARGIGKQDEKGNPAEIGGFIQIAGARYTIDASVESTVQMDSERGWAGSPTGEYRVRDVQVYDREAGEYLPLELDRTYVVAGNNYMMRNKGDGYNMLANGNLVKDYVGEDYLIASAYAASFAEGEDGMPHICTANSPLTVLSGYLLNYENSLGAGRILQVAKAG